MLVLTRKIGERICLSDNIVITVVAIERQRGGGSRVRIGIEAPRETQIWREEVPPQQEEDHAVSSES